MTANAEAPEIHEHLHHLDSKKEEKRKKKQGLIEEKHDPDCEKLEVPQNGMTYKEYLEQLKLKNQDLLKSANQPRNVPKTENALEATPKVDEEAQYQQWINSIHAKKKKTKEKKIDSAEQELNRMVGEKLSITTEGQRSKPGYYDRTQKAVEVRGNPTKS